MVQALRDSCKHFMNKQKKQQNEARRRFLLTFFDDDHRYQALFTRGFWLVRYRDNSTHKWRVAIYPQKSFNKRREYGS